MRRFMRFCEDNDIEFIAVYLIGCAILGILVIIAVIIEKS
jgi:hypothetical protein